MRKVPFGIINLNKPRGITSHAAVLRVRRTLGLRQVGHGGTLDPEATGVLPLLVGRATKLAPYVADMDKAYRAEMTLGVATDTQDATGRVVARHEACAVTSDALASCLRRFVGELQQVPPMVSAVKIGGRRLYEMARAGEVIDRPARAVTIYSLRLREIVPSGEPLTIGARVVFDVECSKGTYVRTLCHDIGEALGCGAHMSGLVRTRVGPFRLADALTLEELDGLKEEGTLDAAFSPPELALVDLARVDVSPEDGRRLQYGQTIKIPPDAVFTPEGSPPPPDAQGVPCAVLMAATGELLGIARYELERERLRPVRILRNLGGEA